MTNAEGSMNRTAAVRDYIAAHPDSTVSEIVAGTGLCPKLVSNGCKKMALRGLLVAHPIQGRRPNSPRGYYSYTIGRPAIESRSERAALATQARMAKRPPSQQPSVKKRSLRLALTDICAKSAMIAAPSTAPETSDQFAARGGRIEVISGFCPVPSYVRPARMARHGAGAQ